MLYAQKSAMTVFIVGLLVLAVLSVVGLVYLSQMAFSDEVMQNGKYCGNTNTTERNISRLTIVLLWVQFAWILLPVWKYGYHLVF